MLFFHVNETYVDSQLYARTIDFRKSGPIELWLTRITSLVEFLHTIDSQFFKKEIENVFDQSQFL